MSSTGVLQTLTGILLLGWVFLFVLFISYCMHTGPGFRIQAEANKGKRFLGPAKE